MDYSIIIQPSAQRQLERLSTDAQRRISATFDALAKNPRPHGYKKIVSKNELYRIRIGDYRVIYNVNDKILRILIVKVGHRGDVYE